MRDSQQSQGDREGPMGLESKGTKGGKVRDRMRERQNRQKTSETQSRQDGATEKPKGTE